LKLETADEPKVMMLNELCWLKPEELFAESDVPWDERTAALVAAEDATLEPPLERDAEASEDGPEDGRENDGESCDPLLEAVELPGFALWEAPD
jgi:hypothetical protein